MKISPGDRQALGRRGEERAAEYLSGKGYRILERNARTRWGEIDLVALDGSILVFVEVKARRGEASGAPLESITPSKAARLKRLGSAWLARHAEHEDREARFDAVGITLDGAVERIEHVENALE